MHLTDLMKGKFVITAEVLPPKPGGDMEKFVEKASALAEHADFINVVDSASAAMGSVDASKLLQDSGIKTVAHIAAWERSMSEIEAIISRAVGAGLENFLCMSGRGGSVVSIFDVIAAVKENSVCVGAVADPYSNNIAVEIQRLKKKEDAGADFIMTQPVFDVNDALKFREWAGVKAPVIFGIAMVNFGWVQVFKSVGIHVPGEYEMGIRNNEERSLEFARAMLSEFKKKFGGAFVMPYGMEHRFAELVK